MTNILITGGAGYIGSHVVKQFLETTNYNITIIDNFKTGFENTIETLQLFSDINFINQDLSNWNEVDKIFKENNFDVVIHFAASLLVGESVTNPLKYYVNNTCNSANIISLCNKYKVNKFIFSSTAAVYGEPDIKTMPLREDTITRPINPYGSSKLFTEQIIKDNAIANKDFKYVILRYFNVAGAEESLQIGECHDPETHLIPLVVKTALGKRDKIMIFGDDYETKDGTCIRDYIHVDDLASAHLYALNYLEDNASNIFNCGYGHGFSVKEVIDTIKKVSGIDFKVEITIRRDGDPAVLVADNTKILEYTNWKPKYDNLEFICKTALDWEKKLG
jgi:UDP-glucose 4-epimerase